MTRKHRAGEALRSTVFFGRKKRGRCHHAAFIKAVRPDRDPMHVDSGIIGINYIEIPIMIDSLTFSVLRVAARILRPHPLLSGK